MRMYDEIRLAPLRFPRDREVSPLLAELLSRMLAKDPAERMTLPQIMSHPWITHNGTAPLACLQVPQLRDKTSHASVLCCAWHQGALTITADACCIVSQVRHKLAGAKGHHSPSVQPAHAASTPLLGRSCS